MARIKSEQIKRVKGIKDAMAAPLSKTPVDTDKKKRRKLKKSLARQLRRQIRDLQQSTKPMISKAPVQRLCREIAQNINEADPARFTQESLSKLQDAAEAYLHGLFHDAYKLTTRVGNRQTLSKEEFKFVVDAQEEARQRFNGCHTGAI